MARGNWNLSGWTVPANSYWTSELAVGALVVRFLGSSDALLSILPSLTYCGLFAVSLLLASETDASVWGSAALVSFYLGFPSAFFADFLFRVGGGHIATLLLCLAAFYFDSRSIAASAWRAWMNAGLAGACLCLAAAGDPLALFAGVAPAVCAGALVALRQKTRKPWPGLAACACAAILARLIVSEASAGNGFHVLALKASWREYLVTWDSLPRNLSLLGRSLLGLAGWDLGGRFGIKTLLTGGVRIAGLGAGLYLTVINLVGGRPQESDAEFLDCVLILGIAADLAAFTFSSMPTDIWSARYALPAFIYALVICARSLGRVPLRSSGAWAAAVLLACIVPALPTSIKRYARRPDVSKQALADWLVERGLRRGYGPYWQANITTVLSHGEVEVYPVWAPDGRIRAYHWMSRDDWYRNPAHFMVFDSSEPFGAVDAETAAATFGPPDHRETVGEYQVLSWSADIHDKLRVN